MKKKVRKIVLEGASGASYRLRVRPWDHEFGAVGAVYVVTERKERMDGGHWHSRIFAGQTGDLSARVADHRKFASFESRGANCVCFIKETRESERVRIEADLMKKYRPPCNE